MMRHTPTAELARGKWRGILMALGMDGKFLADRHGPCPMCGGKDRFRFDNKDGNGTWICGACGAGNGMELVKLHLGCEFREAAKRVDEVLGSGAPIASSKPKAEWTDAEIREAKRALYGRSRPIEAGDVAARYLASRGLGSDEWPAALRTAPPDGQGFASIVAVISDAEGKPASLHQTYVTDRGKAPIGTPRRMAKGPLPDGACIRLSAPRADLCIAEGIETALSVERLFETPCWAVLNTSMMSKFIPPPECTSLTICADNDAKYGGEAAAYALAHRLACKHPEMDVNVRVPEIIGEDWNDVLMRTPSTLESQT